MRAHACVYTSEEPVAFTKLGFVWRLYIYESSYPSDWKKTNKQTKQTNKNKTKTTKKRCWISYPAACNVLSSEKQSSQEGHCEVLHTSISLPWRWFAFRVFIMIINPHKNSDSLANVRSVMSPIIILMNLLQTKGLWWNAASGYISHNDNNESLANVRSVTESGVRCMPLTTDATFTFTAGDALHEQCRCHVGTVDPLNSTPQPGTQSFIVHAAHTSASSSGMEEMKTDFSALISGVEETILVTHMHRFFRVGYGRIQPTKSCTRRDTLLVRYIDWHSCLKLRSSRTRMKSFQKIKSSVPAKSLSYISEFVLNEHSLTRNFPFKKKLYSSVCISVKKTHVYLFESLEYGSDREGVRDHYELFWRIVLFDHRLVH